MDERTPESGAEFLNGENREFSAGDSAMHSAYGETDSYGAYGDSNNSGYADGNDGNNSGYADGDYGYDGDSNYDGYGDYGYGEAGEVADGNGVSEESFMVEQMLPLIEWVAEQMPGGFLIYLSNEEQSLIYVNTAILRMFGCQSLEEFRDLTGGTFRGVVHPEDYEAVQESIEHQIADASNENLDYVEYRIVRQDGGVRWVNGYGHFVGTPGLGGVHYVFLSDVTEKHIAQEENRRRAEVIEGLSVDFQSIFLVDLDSGAIHPYRVDSAVFPELSGEPPKNPLWHELLSLYADRCVLELDREAFLEDVSIDKMRARLEARTSYTVNWRVRSSGGTDSDICYMQISVVRIGDPDACFHAVMGFQDVTEQVLRVQRDAANRLRMEVALEKEKQAHEAKSEFLFSVSHDVRTPMNAIMGFTDLARQHIREPERLRGYLDKVRESSEHMLSLIDNLLEMSQIDSGHIHLKPEACSLREQMDSVLALMEGQAEAKGVALSADLNIPETRVLIDIHCFRRILTNLTDNAVKFTPKGGSVKVSAKAGPASDSGYARYEFQVSDTGVGISKEFSGHMFQAFEREESSTKSGVLGTGLGLSIVKNMLDAMGGSIAVQSQKGIGSTFTVNLPIKQIGEGDGEDTEETDAPLASAAKKPGEHRILLVEDIELNRMLAETILEEAGFLVESVPDGSDAVEAIEKHPLWYFDLVLMDIQMPVMNGYEATRAIRAMDRADVRKLPIIALSANARDEDRRMSMESGMNNHIAKPFDIVRLISTINAHIEEREDSQEESGEEHQEAEDENKRENGAEREDNGGEQEDGETSAERKGGGKEEV